ncbi:Palmitoyltransferase [Operophtera brumata]|uniref:Palmitoyltransferase n=1 Tax=Operophtera brumata TaxID=104452 RepID=A0A0L7LSK2_OPEBR|nr:Palmitoyltransferase [Operophtera brumata]
MDHHCPWINCCVGHANHGYFTMFLVSAVLGCLQATIVLSICMYHAIYRVWYTYHGTGREPVVYVTMTTLPLALLAIGMALGVVLAVGALLYFQIKGILRNQTTIEDWIVEKADCRREEQGLPPFVFPYNLGAKRNVKTMLFHSGDGLKWPVKEGCGEYDLTRARPCRCTVAYSGRWFPLCAFPRDALSPPCSTESRIALSPGDIVTVTRHRKRWLYGEKQVGGGETRGPRGWFPRVAVCAAREHKAD